MGEIIKPDGTCSKSCKVTAVSDKPIEHEKPPGNYCIKRTETPSLERYRTCQTCCEESNSYAIKNEIDLAEKWNK